MLTDRQIRQALSPDDGRKLYKLYDQKGLYVEITSSGSKRWRFRYTLAGKSKKLSLGLYPDTSLKAAREKAKDMRNQLADGFDPSFLRKAKVQAASNTICIYD